MAVAAVNEWSDITGTEGLYSKIYFDWDGSTFYCINDWGVNQDDGGQKGGLLPDEYNLFSFTMPDGTYDIRIYPDGTGKLYKNQIENPDALEEFKSGCSWSTSPNLPDVKHTIWEFSFRIPEVIVTTIDRFKPSDGPGPAIIMNSIPNPLPSVVTSGPSTYTHYPDGYFADINTPPVLPPEPNRSHQEVVSDPWFDNTNWNLILQPSGGITIGIINKNVPHDGTWTGNAGDWSNYDNWTDWPAYGAGSVAYLSGVVVANIDDGVSPLILGGIHSSGENIIINDSSLDQSGITLNAMVGTPTIQADAATTINAKLSGNQGLMKTGSGTLTLSGDLNYTGTTIIDAGTLQINATNTLGDIISTTGNGSLGVGDGVNPTTLTADSVIVDTLTIGAGSTLTIAPILGGQTALADGLAPVPEPGTWLLLAAAGVAFTWFKLQRSSRYSIAKSRVSVPR
jgi:autotransporter-associated beta strand protein